MTMSRKELDELIRKHEEGDIPDSEFNFFREFRVVVVSFLSMMVFGIVLYGIIGVLAAVILFDDIRAFRALAERAAGYFLIFIGVFYAISFFTGRGIFMAEMTRRAWTNSQKQNEQEAVFDYQRFMTPSGIISVLFWGTISAFVFYYYVIHLLLPGFQY